MQPKFEGKGWAGRYHSRRILIMRIQQKISFSRTIKKYEVGALYHDLYISLVKNVCVYSYVFEFLLLLLGPKVALK